MEDDAGLGIGNWGYYEQSLKGNLGLQLMSGIVEQETKPLFCGRGPDFIANGGFIHRDYSAPGRQGQIEYPRDGWINQREKFYPEVHGHQNCTVPSGGLGTYYLHSLLPHNLSKNDQTLQIEDTSNKQDRPLKKRSNGSANKPPKENSRRSCCTISKEGTIHSFPKTKATRRHMEVVINGIDVDISGIPTPVCSCTGFPIPCYRWGCGGWQSACCTSTISKYPLPLSTKRRSARIAGRKMSQGAFKKVLEKLAAEGHNLSNPIDLKTHWAKHGTNKFVTIK